MATGRKNIKEEIKSVVSAQLQTKFEELKINDSFLKDEVRKALNKYFGTSSMFQKYKPTEEMREILLDEFKKKAQQVDYDGVESLIMKEARAMIELKMKQLTNTMKLVDEML